MPSYGVIWEIELDADSPEDAARAALAIQRDPSSWATSFEVYPEDGSGEQVHVNIADLDDD